SLLFSPHSLPSLSSHAVVFLLMNEEAGTTTGGTTAPDERQQEDSRQKEKRIQKYVTFKEGKTFGKWSVVKKIDEGGFGKVYLMEIKGKDIRAALKAEPNEVEGGSAIKLELQVLRAINPKGDKPHIPQVYHAAKRKRFCYMIMTLLGENFKALRNKMERYDGSWPTLSVSTWTRLGIQCLYALKVVHDNGYLHRDIKPNNFVMGNPVDSERFRIVFILDFGLSRSYAFKSKDGSGKWTMRLARATAEFRGTARYCSPNVHDKMEQGRRDDIWSLFYVLIELHCGLPWQDVREKDKIEYVKCHYRDDHLMQNMPRELRGVIPALRKLDCYGRPDYASIHQALVAVMKRYKVGYDDLYDWERDSDLKVLKASKKPPWYTPEEFFKSDPIGINSGPASAERVSQDTAEAKTIGTIEHTKGD
ncbi:hypothetical protein PFISCL1PPCAC_24474, partial [Pristionchus fissidentatus]